MPAFWRRIRRRPPLGPMGAVAHPSPGSLGPADADGARLILPYLREAAPRSVLDVGFGCGHWSFWLARDPSCRRIVAVDPDASRVADARHVAAVLGLESLEFRSGHVPEAIADLPPQTLDAVIAIEVLQLVGPLTACVELLWNLLRPGGLLVAHVPSLGYMRAYDRHRLDVEDLERLCTRSGFEVGAA